jgi:hypothetical protein
MYKEDDSKMHEAGESLWLKQAESAMGSMPLGAVRSNQGETLSMQKMSLQNGVNAMNVPKMPMP